MAEFTTSYTENVILGVSSDLEGSTPVTPRNDLQSTLNRKYNIQADLLPTATPKARFFGIGIGGRRNTDDGNGSEPVPIKRTNMDLYSPVPFRCVPLTQDLTSTQRALYRMRTIWTFGGIQYACYWLKKLNVTDEFVRLSRSLPNGTEEPYTIDYANLSPTPPAPIINGTPDLGTEINITTTAYMPFTGEEVAEYINIRYAGDLRYAVISELGVYRGNDQTVNGDAAGGGTVSYTESILTQLVAQHTWQGASFAAPSSTFNGRVLFGKGDIIDILTN